MCFLVERRFGVGHGIWGGLGLDGVLWEVHGVYWKGKGVDMVWYGHGLNATNNGQAVHMCDNVTACFFAFCWDGSKRKNCKTRDFQSREFGHLPYLVGDTHERCPP